MSNKRLNKIIDNKDNGTNNKKKKNRYTIVLKGNPATKKNSSQIKYIYSKNKGRRVPIIVPSENYNVYRELCMYQLNSLVNSRDFETIDYPINLKTIYYMEDLTVCDISNLINATHDILEDAGVIKEDSWKIVNSVDGSRVRFDPKNPRVEIFIDPVEDEKSSALQADDVKREREEKRVRKRKIRERQKEEERKELAKEVKYLREEKALPWKEVVKKVGVSQSTAYKYYKKYYLDKGGE